MSLGDVCPGHHVTGVAEAGWMIVRSALDKNPMPGHHFEGNPVDEGTTEGLLNSRASSRKTRRFYTQLDKWNVTP